MKKQKQWIAVVVSMLLAFSFAFAPVASIPAAAVNGQFLSLTYSGRNYKLYVPASYSAGTDVPLFVMLHGGAQDPTDFANGTQMNALADTENFLVLYPEQPTSANSSKCWNWFETSHQSRGSGEPALIAGMVNTVKSNYSVDDDKVFVAGISAGAAMAVIMGATYPDIFSAIGVCSGLEYKAATSMTAAFTAMSSGGPTPTTQGQLAYNAMGSYARVIRTIVFQGSSDYTVYPVNGNQVLSQWARTDDLADDGSVNSSVDDTADVTETGTAPVSNGKSYTRYVYENTAGDIVLEKYIVTGMGHAWSGGSSSGSYTDPTGPDASRIIYDFCMNGSETPTVDKTALASAISAAQAINLNLYTDATAAAVTSALSSAQTVYANSGATQAQVDSAASALNAAVANLVLKENPPEVDKTALASAISAAQAINLNLYTDATAAAVTSALSSAQTVYADEDATQAQVDSAASALNTAVANLVLKENPPEVDKTALASAISAAQAINLNLYTDATAAAVTSALSSAQTVYANSGATQAQVDSATSALNTAVANLVLKETPAAGTFLSGTYSGRNYKLYVPGSYTAGTAMPLIVMLHGSSQTPTQFASETQMNDLADERGFLALYPEQPITANGTLAWNWFLTAHQSRGSGEPALIAGMVGAVESGYTVDTSRVFAAGMGAGGAMAVILGATYPDVFKGIGVSSGLEYKAATSILSAYTAMYSGGPAPATQGQLAYTAMGSYAAPVRVLVMQGSSDTTVYPVNGNQVLSQWAKTDDLADDGTANNSVDDTADLTQTGTSAGGLNYTRYVYENTSGAILLEKYVVTSMGYGWPGGSSGGSKTQPNGPDLSAILCDFFLG